jgi:hypothetical protein
MIMITSIPEADGEYVVGFHWTAGASHMVFQLWSLRNQVNDDGRRLVSDAVQVQGVPACINTVYIRPMNKS